MKIAARLIFKKYSIFIGDVRSAKYLLRKWMDVIILLVGVIISFVLIVWLIGMKHTINVEIKTRLNMLWFLIFLLALFRDRHYLKIILI